MLMLPSLKAKLSLKFLMVTLLLGSSLSPHIANAKESTTNSSVQSKNPDSELMIKDYGTYGQVFNIAEECLLKEIMERLELAKENGTLEQLQSKFTEKVKSRVLRPLPVPNLRKSIANRSWTYNPTFTQETDIIDHEGRVIIAAGTNINALEKLKWVEPLILIDGEDKDQVKWASGKTGKIVLTNGAPLALGEQLKRPVFFDQGGIFCHRFKIEATPAVIEQDGLLLKVSEVKI